MVKGANGANQWVSKAAYSNCIPKSMTVLVSVVHANRGNMSDGVFRIQFR